MPAEERSTPDTPTELGQLAQSEREACAALVDERAAQWRSWERMHADAASTTTEADGRNVKKQAARECGVIAGELQKAAAEIRARGGHNG